MKTKCTIAAVALMLAVQFGCTKGGRASQSRSTLRDVLNQTTLADNERFGILEDSITNGMTIAQVVQLLGTNYMPCYPYSMVGIPEEDKRISLQYSFPQLEFSVLTSNPLSGDPLNGVCTGIGRSQRMETGQSGARD